MRKQFFGVSDQVRHKPGCTVKEDGWRLGISYLGSRGIVRASLFSHLQKAGFLMTRLIWHQQRYSLDNSLTEQNYLLLRKKLYLLLMKPKFQDSINFKTLASFCSCGSELVPCLVRNVHCNCLPCWKFLSQIFLQHDLLHHKIPLKACTVSVPTEFIAVSSSLKVARQPLCFRHSKSSCTT